MSDELEFAPGQAARWTWSAADIRQLGHRVVDLIAEHLTQIADQPVFRPFPNDRAQAMLTEALPEQGRDVEAIIERFAEDVMPYPFGNGHPRFAGWVNGPPVVVSVFAEALAAAMDPSVAGGNHAATYVERQVLEWLKQLIGFPADGMGLLVSGGSAATQIARMRASPRDWRQRPRQWSPVRARPTAGLHLTTRTLRDSQGRRAARTGTRRSPERRMRLGIPHRR